MPLELRKRKVVFQRLVEPHMNSLFQVAWRLTGSSDEAEDLVQDLLVRLYPKTGQMQEVQLLGPWLKKALYRQFLDMQRKKVRRPENFLSASNPQMDDLEAEEGDPVLMAQRAADQRRLRQALRALDPESRSLVLMRLVEGYSLVELEEIFKVPHETVKTRLRRAKAKLKKILQS